MGHAVQDDWVEKALSLGLEPKRCELVDGQPVERAPMSFKGSDVLSRLDTLLRLHATQARLGTVFVATARYLVQEHPRRERLPDVSFLSTARLPESRDIEVYPGAPDLAVEVRSPSDRSGAVRAKAQEYLTAGASQVWVVDPLLETITVLSLDRPPKPYGRGDLLEAPDLLPGLAVDLEALFRGE